MIAAMTPNWEARHRADCDPVSCAEREEDEPGDLGDPRDEQERQRLARERQSRGECERQRDRDDPDDAGRKDRPRDRQVRDDPAGREQARSERQRAAAAPKSAARTSVDEESELDESRLNPANTIPTATTASAIPVPAASCSPAATARSAATAPSVEVIGATTPTLPILTPAYTSSSPAQLPTPARISHCSSVASTSGVPS